LVVKDLVLEGMDRKEGCRQGKEGVEKDDDESCDSHSVLPEPSPGIHPEAHALDGQIELVHGFYSLPISSLI
jgi:hypothetical protein